MPAPRTVVKGAPAMDQNQRALSKMRIRGAPSANPAVGPLVPEYSFEPVFLPAWRAIVVSLGNGRLDFAKLGPAIDALEAHAATLPRARVVGAPFVLLASDPAAAEPHKRDHEVGLPMQGELKPAEDGSVTLRRIDDGAHLRGTVSGTSASLEHVWTYLNGRLFPEKSHRLARPTIVLGLLTDPRKTDDEAMEWDVAVPVVPVIPGERKAPGA